MLISIYRLHLILRLIPFPNKKAYGRKESDDADKSREMADGS